MFLGCAQGWAQLMRRAAAAARYLGSLCSLRVKWSAHTWGICLEVPTIFEIRVCPFEGIMREMLIEWRKNSGRQIFGSSHLRKTYPGLLCTHNWFGEKSEILLQLINLAALRAVTPTELHVMLAQGGGCKSNQMPSREKERESILSLSHSWSLK